MHTERKLKLQNRDITKFAGMNKVGMECLVSFVETPRDYTTQTNYNILDKKERLKNTINYKRLWTTCLVNFS